jgi:hypothetical protein
MQGTLFKYGPGSAHVAFKSPATAKHARCSGQLHLVLLGGLTDGLLFAPYCEKLAAAAGDLGWSLVQAQLTSSYQVCCVTAALQAAQFSNSQMHKCQAN